MRVELVQSPEQALKTVYTACRTCYSGQEPYEIYTTSGYCGKHKHDNHDYCMYCVEDSGCEGNEKMLKLVSKVLAAGHYSTVEHCHYTFTISGISRALSHQLVRTRHASYSQQSQRYVSSANKSNVEDPKYFKYVTPQSIHNITHLGATYDQFMYYVQNFYDELVEGGVPEEDARYILPNACETSLVMSINLRSLIHKAGYRLCANAQWEYRQLMKELRNLVIKQDPWLEPYIQPKCVKDGYCSEIKSCGRFSKKD